MTIFLAEDDEDDALLFKDAVTSIRTDVKLVTLCDGEKLMTRLKTDSLLPDIIFLDLNMPRKNGFECLHEIKSHTSWRAIKTIILSTTSDFGEFARCYKLGADVCLAKPNNYDNLKSKLSHYLN